MTQYRLQSSSFIHAPGMVRNARHMWTTGDERLAFEIMSSWEGLPGSVVLQYFKGEIEPEIDGDTVVFKTEIELDASKEPETDAVGV